MQLTTDWARKVRFSVGAPNYAGDRYLNDLKHEVITALLELESNLRRIARANRYDFELSPQRYRIKENKHTTVFTIILDGSHSSDTSQAMIEANIKAVHEAVHESVDAVLTKLQVVEKLAKYFGDK